MQSLYKHQWCPIGDSVSPQPAPGTLGPSGGSSLRRWVSYHSVPSSWGGFSGQVRGAYQRAALRKNGCRHVTWLWIKQFWWDMRSLFRNYVRGSSRDLGLSMGCLRVLRTPGKLPSAREHVSFHPMFPSHPWNRQHWLLGFSNKGPRPSSLRPPRFPSLSPEGPPAAGFALHHRR